MSTGNLFDIVRSDTAESPTGPITNPAPRRSKGHALRPYQEEARAAIHQEWQENQATLLVHATGLGKTEVACHVIADRLKYGKAMFLAHRMELVTQAAKRIHKLTGIEPAIEMAGRWAHPNSRIVVSSIQTQVSGFNGDGRMTRFDPSDFSTIVQDEAHHSPAESFQRVLSYYTQNREARLLGITATPDRTDEVALGKVFDSVAHVYEIQDAIKDGWLVPVKTQMVHVTGLDFSNIRTTAGDLNGADLDAVMRYEETLHGMISPTLDISGNRKTLVFAVSVAHAERIAEIINRHKPGAADWVHGGTPKEQRRDVFDRYSRGAFQYLVNVGIVTEGVDIPGIEVVAMFRPTKSRALYAQICGRATRALPGVVDGIDDAEARRDAIAASPKPDCLVLDYVGNAGRHRLVHAADILGGKYDDEVVDRANRILEQNTDSSMDVEDALEDAIEQIDEEKKKEQQRRARVTAKAKYQTTVIDPFGIVGAGHLREYGWDTAKPASDKQVALLKKWGINAVEFSSKQASALIGRCIQRSKGGLATPKQLNVLVKAGYSVDEVQHLSLKGASTVIDAVKANRWRRVDHELLRQGE